MSKTTKLDAKTLHQLQDVGAAVRQLIQELEAGHFIAAHQTARMLMRPLLDIDHRVFTQST